MQAIAPVTTDQLLASGQEPKAKFEIYVAPYWVNICDGFSFLLSPCDATTDWYGTALSIDTDDKKEGTGSLKDDVAAPVIDTGYHTIYNPAGSWDWSAKEHILFWFKCDRPNTAFTSARFFIYDTLNNYRWWHLTFSAGEWTAVKKLLSAGDGESGVPPDLALINSVRVRFDTADITPFYKKIDDLRLDDVAPGLTGKNYLEDWSISLGGASMTPNPIGGTWSVTLFNEDGIFHPQHPTSAYKDWLKTGKKVRISIGGKYGGTDYYWQRIIGYMDEPKFSTPDYRVNISGGDYMKFLQDAEFQELDATYPNHWGSSATFDSWPSDGLVGGELYDEKDPMDIDDDVLAIPGGTWTAVGCAFTAFADGTAPSNNVGRMQNPVAGCHIKNLNVAAGVTGSKYKVSLQYRGVGGVGMEDMTVQIRQTAGLCKEMIYPVFDAWNETPIFEFTALDNTAIQIWIYGHVDMADLRLDLFSITEYVPEVDRYYQLPGASKGPYHVTYNDGGGVDPVQQGEEDEGWYHEEATQRVFFDRNKTVIDGAGTNNVVVYYYTVTDPEDAVARILYFAKAPDPATGNPFANEAAALAAMDNDDPGFAIDKVWFKAGSTFLSAIRMLCERCNYRFYFKYDGTPVFKAVPAPGGLEFTFTSPAHIASSSTYQSRSEIKNRVIIKGIKQAEPGNRDESAPSELTGEAHDDTSIAAYGERTLTITNYLFQTQGPLDAMCATLLALYKDPNWYADLKVPFNPVPLELVDDIQWEERLSHVLDVTQTGVIRDIKIDGFNTTYKCEKT